MKKKDFLFLILCVVIGLLLAAFYTKEPDFDWYSYHFYNGWAFLDNRYHLDFMSCQFRTYFNPVLDAISFFLVKNLNGNLPLFLFISVLKYIIYIFFGYKIYDLIFTNNQEKSFCIVVAFILLLLSPIPIFISNFEYTDLQVGLLCLVSLYILLKNIFVKKTQSFKYYLFITLAGILFGAAFGLKYTVFASAVSAFFALICLHKYVYKFYKTFLCMFLGFIFGFLLTNGWWMLFLWDKFQNPMFPYFNDIFRSPMAQEAQMLDTDMQHIRPSNFIEFVFYPLYNTLVHYKVGFEVLFGDIKFPLTFLFSFVALIQLFFTSTKFKLSKITNPKMFYFILFYLIFTYYINQIFFANVRYISVLYPISSIIILSVIRTFVSKRSYVYISLLLLVAAAVIFKPSNSTIRCNFYYSNPIKILDMTRYKFRDNDTVLCANFTSSFAIPFQDNTESIKIYGLPMPILFEDLNDNGYWYRNGFVNMYFFSGYLQNMIPEIIKNSKGLVYIYADNNLGEGYKDFKYYDKALQFYSDGRYRIENCKTISYSILGDFSPLERFHICRLK